MFASFLFLKTLRDVAPVDHVPDSTEVLGLAVLVLEVVGVLPGVNAHEWLQVASDGVLVGTGDDAESARSLILDEPGPARALNAGEGSVGLLLEVVEGAEVLVNGSLTGFYIISLTAYHKPRYFRGRRKITYQELALGLTTTTLAVGGEVLPEERVVDVATAVEVDERCLGSGSLGVALGLGLSEGLDCGVEAVDVGLVVLGVVELHDLARDVRLESAIIVCVSTRTPLLSATNVSLGGAGLER